MNRRRLIGGCLAALAVAAVGAFAWVRFVRAVDLPIAEAAQGTVAVRVVGPGTVQARVPVTLAARITATVRQVDADVGDAVRRGQVLAVLDERDLAARRGVVGGQREAVERNVRAAQAAVAKAQALAHELRYADTVLSFARIVAPMDGVIIARTAEVGATVVPGTPVFRMVDPATLWVATRVDEWVVGRVRVGQPATIRLRTGETLAGKVARIARQSDAATRELEVNVAFAAPPARFAIDQEAEVTIDAGAEQGIVVPLAALTRSAEGVRGVLVVADGRTRFRPVETGAADGERVPVRNGLAAGERIVARAEGARANLRVRAAG
ncbi:MAG: efflux RND transporter periplasmic adaptor subunit [Burkholderiaceae bacterium]